ncbi:MAG: hypothetical protein VW235_13460, partial [Rhodospirillaceae bacterium]
ITLAKASGIHAISRAKRCRAILVKFDYLYSFRPAALPKGYDCEWHFPKNRSTKITTLLFQYNSARFGSFPQHPNHI